MDESVHIGCFFAEKLPSAVGTRLNIPDSRHQKGQSAQRGRCQRRTFQKHDDDHRGDRDKIGNQSGPAEGR